MKLRDYLTEEKPTKQQTDILKKLLKNHKDKVVTSFMKGNVMHVETQKTKHNVYPDGQVISNIPTKAFE